MADCSCDFCTRDNHCPYAYNESDCRVETIKAAKVVVDDKFKAFLANLEEKNKDMYDDSIARVIWSMREVVRDSEMPLPDWAIQETKAEKTKENKSKFYVTFKIDARYVTEVEASNVEEAKKKASAAFSDADFGAAEDIDGEEIIVEDENGNYVWEK